MSTITMWYRLEPRARSTDLAESLAARVNDPLWFLTRQWQFGEFGGEDGGSAVAGHVRGQVAPLTHVRLGPSGAASARQGTRSAPLEPEIESGSHGNGRPTAREAADAGTMWLAMLTEAGLPQYRTTYIDHAPFVVDASGADRDDPQSRAFQRLLAGKVPDGRLLFAELNSALNPEGGGAGALPAVPDVGTDRETIETLARRWLERWIHLTPPSQSSVSAWVPEKLEYQFAVAAPSRDGEVVLEASEYAGDHIDWYQFRLGGEPLGAAVAASQIEEVELAATPIPVTIAGQPASRFWEMEDGLVDFARIEAAPEDLARLIHVEFGLLYGDDWLFMPLDLPVGTVFQTDQLEVEDTFGVRTVLSPTVAADDTTSSWRLFHLSQSTGARREQTPPAPLFLVPPVMASSLDGLPVEEVLLLRDEMANLAWGVERRIEGARGRAFERGESYARRRARTEPPTAAPNGLPSYRMHGRVPDYWIPFMPVQQAKSRRSVSLQRGSVRDPETGQFQRPMGRLLVPNEPLVLDEEQVPRSGVRLALRSRLTRDGTGNTRIWTACQRSVGRGEGSSGVRFDRIEP